MLALWSSEPRILYTQVKLAFVNERRIDVRFKRNSRLYCECLALIKPVLADLSSDNEEAERVTSTGTVSWVIKCSIIWKCEGSFLDFGLT